jgi:N-acetylglucosamine-6-phosphate deacetylase
MKLGVQAAVVGGAVVPGDVIVGDGRILAVGLRPTGGHGVAFPGFVDLQVNGYGGVDCLRADAGGFGELAAMLPATGVTAWQPTLITAPPEDVVRALVEIGAAREAAGADPAARILGAHVEGPFLAPPWAGVHPREHLRPPDVAVMSRLCDAGPVGMVTLAPELPGAADVIGMLIRRGVLVAAGHSDADAAQATRAFDLGVRAVTHVHNAHRRWTSRDPGLAGAALVDRRVTATVICDGVHLDPVAVRGLLAAAPGRLAAVTDAVPAAGLDDGSHPFGPVQVEVRDGAARLADGRLAGSVLTMDAAARNLARWGADLPAVAALTSGTAARLIGGSADLTPGSPADVVVLDDDLGVARTLVAGKEAYAA